MKFTDQMIAQGVIELFSSAWSNPVIILKKKNGDYGFVTDFRKLNNSDK